MPISREEILDLTSYEQQRDAIRQRIFEVKRPRRIHVGEHLTFLFENEETMLYQVQEMVRAERMVKDDDIQHEVRTYNEVLGGAGELGCTLLIEIDDRDERAEKLARWLDLPRHLYCKVEDGEKVYASYDERQVGEERISSVQYIKFDTGGRRPIAVGTDFAPLVGEVELTAEQREALAADLQG